MSSLLRENENDSQNQLKRGHDSVNPIWCIEHKKLEVTEVFKLQSFTSLLEP